MGGAASGVTSAVAAVSTHNGNRSATKATAVSGARTAASAATTASAAMMAVTIVIADAGSARSAGIWRRAERRWRGGSVASAETR